MIHFWKINFKYLVIAIQYKKFSKNLEKDFRLWKKSETFYFLNGIIDYGSLCIDYESLLKTVGQLLLIRSIYRIRFELKAHKGSGCPQNSKAERESEFWLDRILMGIHEEFPWLKNRGKTIPENLLVFPEKKVMDWPCSKHGGYFVPIPWRALCGQEIFSMRIEVFSIQVEDIFSTALIKEARIHDYRNQKTPV